VVHDGPGLGRKRRWVAGVCLLDHARPASQSCTCTLLAHLATLTRNQVRFAGATATVPMLAEPTSEQREAFQLIGAPIPLTMT
jgi:hypothetical protein